MSAHDFKIVFMDPDEIIPFELNSKKHPPEQIAKIAESIAKTGWDQPIVVDRDLVIIKGHGRRLAAKLLGPKHPRCERGVPVLVRKDLTPEQVRVARLADNRSAISDLDPEMLRQEMAGIEEDLKGIFDDKELSFVGADLGTMNSDVFANDMGEVLEEQRASVDAKVAAAAAAEVSIAKAFGFAKVPATAMRGITILIAKAEAATGLKEAAALAALAEQLP